MNIMWEISVTILSNEQESPGNIEVSAEIDDRVEHHTISTFDQFDNVENITD